MYFHSGVAHIVPKKVITSIIERIVQLFPLAEISVQNRCCVCVSQK